MSAMVRENQKLNELTCKWSLIVILLSHCVGTKGSRAHPFRCWLSHWLFISIPFGSVFTRQCRTIEGELARAISRDPFVPTQWLRRSTIKLHLQVSSFMYQSIPKPPIPPGQYPGIWLALGSVQWGIWPKMRPARWGIWLSCQNVCQRSEAEGFRNSLIQQVSPVHGSLFLSIPRGFFCCCRFIWFYCWICLCLKCGAKTSWTRNS